VVTGDPLELTYRAANSLKDLYKTEYTSINSYEDFDGQISFSGNKYIQFNNDENPESDGSSNLAISLNVSTDNEFNLIGDITKFISAESEYENIIKPFKDNTNLKELINFKINYADSLNRSGGDEFGNWEFWTEQFSGCTNLESADIIFELPIGSENPFYAKLTNLFTGCKNLSYIKVITKSFQAQFASNDWLDASTLPNNGILILPTGFKRNTAVPNVVTSAGEVNPVILSYECVQTLLNKNWTIKFED
jgi:hypothetical protein